MNTLERLEADWKVEMAKFSEAVDSRSSTCHPDAFRDAKVLEVRIEKLKSSSGVLFDSLLGLLSVIPSEMIGCPEVVSAMDAINLAKYGKPKKKILKSD